MLTYCFELLYSGASNDGDPSSGGLTTLLSAECFMLLFAKKKVTRHSHDCI